ncbi:MAG: hypothetical protein RI907_1889 [Pseudomonadota bacterium]
MLESEKFAIAAHLHVLLRRVNGRVTDVEWMIRSPEYAREVIRVARTEEHADLRKLADKLEAALQVGRVAAGRAPQPAAPARQPVFAHSESGEPSTQPPSGYPSSTFGSTPSGFDPKVPPRKRYVGSLR